MNFSVLFFFCILGVAVAANAKTKMSKKASTTTSSFSAEEMFCRYQNAQKEVDELNEKYPSATFAINKFSFMSEAERKMYVRGPKFSKSINFVSFDDENITAPESYDYRDYGKVTPVKDQDVPLFCGSCYAFGGTAAVESQYLIQKNLELDLSEEYVLECDTVDDECEGGYATHVLDLYQKDGVPSEDCVPYTSLNGTCPTVSCDKYKIAGYRAVGEDEDKYPGLLYKYGPITISFLAGGKQFDQYKNGTLDYPIDECGTQDDGHVVLLVGYTKDYWIAKNSWGIETWGENGYFRFKRGINWCNFATEDVNVIPFLN